MTRSEIMESSRLIDEFMGVDNSIPHDHQGMWQYHASWDALMPVINKIYQSNEYVKYQSHTSNIVSDGAIYINTMFIETTFSDVVEFIKWYNKSKLNEAN